MTSDEAQPAAAGSGVHALIRGSVAAVAGRIAAIAISLAQAVGLLRLLGPDLYGVWSLMAAVLTATAVLDFGLPGAVERQVARSHARRDPAAAGRAVAAAALAIVAGAAVVQLILLFWAFAVADRAAMAAEGLAVLPAAFTVGLLALVPGAAVTALGRFGTFHAWRTLGLTVGAGLTLALASIGVRRMAPLVIAHAAGSLLTGIGCWLAARRAWPDLAPALPGRTELVELARLGGGLQTASLAPLAADYGFRILVTTRFGVSAAGVYDLAARMSIVVRSLAGALSSVLVPHSVALLEAADRERVARLHARAVSLILLFAVPLTIALLAAATPLSSAIAPSAGSELRATLWPLLLAHLLACAALPALMIGRAAGQPVAEATAAVGGAVLGLAGAALAPTPALAAATLWGAHAVAIVAAWQWLSRTLPTRHIDGRYLANVAAAAALASAVGAGLHYVAHGTGLERAGTVAGWALGFATFAAVAIRRQLFPRELGSLIRDSRPGRDNA